MRGLPADRYDADNMAKIYWGIGTHFGIAVSQIAVGDRLGHVRDLTKPGEEEGARGYTSARELRLHTDLAQIAGLFCYRQAVSGGTSIVSSALAIHNQIAAEHPHYMPIYYKGFPYHRRDEQAPDAAPVTPHAVPIFSTFKGNTSAFYVREVLQNAADEFGVPLTAKEVAALDYFDNCARANAFQFCLESAEVLHQLRQGPERNREGRSITAADHSQISPIGCYRNGRVPGVRYNRNHNGRHQTQLLGYRCPGHS